MSGYQIGQSNNNFTVNQPPAPTTQGGNFNFDPISGIFNAISGFGQSLINRKTQRDNMNRQKEHNEYMMRLQNDLNIENWARENAYNTPAMQMERLKEAGLNPHLMYGKGTTGNASSLPATSGVPARVDTMPPVTLPNIGAYQDYALKNNQIDLVKTQIEATKQGSALSLVKELLGRADLDMKPLDKVGKQLDNESKELKNEFQAWKNTNAKEKWVIEKEALQLQNDINAILKDYKTFEQEKQSELYNTNLDYMKSQTKKEKALKLEIEQKINESIKRVEKMGYEINHLDRTELIRAYKYKMLKRGVNFDNNSELGSLTQLIGTVFDYLSY